MSATVRRKPITYEDLLAVPDHLVANETVHAEPFEAVGLDMSRWWLRPPESKPEDA